MLKILILLLLITLIQTQLKRVVPIHAKYAQKCVQTLITKQFQPINANGKIENDAHFLTVLVSNNMSTPAYEIQSKLLRNINSLEQFSLEVIESKRNDFNNEIYTKYCLIIVDSLRRFKQKLQIFLKLKTGDPEAYFLVYYTSFETSYEATASHILEELWRNFISNALVLIPKSLQTLQIYTMRFHTTSGQNCLKSSGLDLADSCINGVISSGKTYYKRKLNRSFSNCTLDVVAKKIDPFVISRNEGFEIDFLNEIGRILNVTFNITVSSDDSWGVKEDGFWTNGLGQVYNNSALGIGNFYAVPSYKSDFDFSATYFDSSLVFIVPVAAYVPKWRVLIAIFNWYLWLLCIASIFICAFLFWLLALSSRSELKSYRGLAHDFFISVQVIMSCSVFRQPKSDWVRIIFLNFAVFAIMISSVYTSSLIQFLKYPQREHQVDTIEGVLEAGWDIGGFPVHEGIFQVAPTSDEKSKKIHQIFQVNDSQIVWLQSVADDRDTCTIISDFFVNYMLAKQDPIVTDSKNKSKVFILNEKIYSYGLSIVANKGFLFMDRINRVIGLMNTFGLVKAKASKYTWILSRVKFMQQRSSFTQALSLTHLQGAFAVVLIGGVLGFVVFLGENLVFWFRERIRAETYKNCKRNN